MISTKFLLVLLSIYLGTITFLWLATSQSSHSSGYLSAQIQTPSPQSYRLLAETTDVRTIDCSVCEHQKIPPSQGRFWIYILFCVILCAFAGLFSGLTVGYMGLDPLDLEVKQLNGTEEEKVAAQRIMPLLANHHLLLATLLIGNALCFETLPIFMDALVPSWVAVLISTTFILIFGEILPQALCVGPQQLQIASVSTPLVKVIMYLFMPITYPLAKALDSILGKHRLRRFDRKTLMAILYLHSTKSPEHGEEPSPKELNEVQSPKNCEEECILDPDEVKIIQAIIELKDIKLEEIKIKIDQMLSIEEHDLISKTTLQKIAMNGYSKIPIYRNQKQNIIGTIPTEKLLLAEEYIDDPLNKIKHITPATFVPHDLNLLELLNIFQLKKSQLLYVINRPKFDPITGVSQFEFKNLDPKFEVIGMVNLKDLLGKLCELSLKDEEEYLYSVMNEKHKISIQKKHHKHTFAQESEIKKDLNRRGLPSHDSSGKLTKPLLEKP